jgi:5-methylcytosine-specific restriction protein B
VSEKLAEHLVGGGDGFVEIVQFHPSYSRGLCQGIGRRLRDNGLRLPLVGWFSSSARNRMTDPATAC